MGVWRKVGFESLVKESLLDSTAYPRVLAQLPQVPLLPPPLPVEPLLRVRLPFFPTAQESLGSGFRLCSGLAVSTLTVFEDEPSDLEKTSKMKIPSFILKLGAVGIAMVRILSFSLPPSRDCEGISPRLLYIFFVEFGLNCSPARKLSAGTREPGGVVRGFPPDEQQPMVQVPGRSADARRCGPLLRCS